jgi:5'-3' exonuclease
VVRRPLLAVDAPFVLYRSFFALPQSIKGVDGHPIGALLGATNLVLRLAADRDPRAIVLCFGAEAAEYRVRLYPPYHADRPPAPEALAWQFDKAEELFAELGWECRSSADLEADDLLGSLAASEAESDGMTLIATGDRDMYQCVDEHTHVLFLKSGTVGFEEVDHDEVVRRYGVTPAQVPDFIALRGDPSDSLPGAPGIGAKTAAELLSRHGSLETAIAGAGAERPRVAAALTESASQLRDYREIALLRRIAIDPPQDAQTDLARGAAAAKRFGMGQLARRLEAASSLADL